MTDFDYLKRLRIRTLEIEIRKGKSKLLDFVRKRDREEGKLRDYITDREAEMHTLSDSV